MKSTESEPGAYTGHAAGIIRRITQSWSTFTDFAHFTD